MTMNALIISLAAKLRNLNITSELEKWLLSKYGWEPTDNYWNPDELIDIVEIHCKEYWDDELDTAIPDEAILWKERAETAAFIIQGLEIEKKSLIEENSNYMKLLDEHEIKY